MSSLCYNKTQHINRCIFVIQCFNYFIHHLYNNYILLLNLSFTVPSSLHNRVKVNACYTLKKSDSLPPYYCPNFSPCRPLASSCHGVPIVNSSILKKAQARLDNLAKILEFLVQKMWLLQPHIARLYVRFRIWRTLMSQTICTLEFCMLLYLKYK